MLEMFNLFLQWIRKWFLYWIANGSYRFHRRLVQFQASRRNGVDEEYLLTTHLVYGDEVLNDHEKAVFEDSQSTAFSYWYKIMRRMMVTHPIYGVHWVRYAGTDYAIETLHPIKVTLKVDYPYFLSLDMNTVVSDLSIRFGDRLMAVMVSDLLEAHAHRVPAQISDWGLRSMIMELPRTFRPKAKWHTSIPTGSDIGELANDDKTYTIDRRDVFYQQHQYPDTLLGKPVVYHAAWGEYAVLGDLQSSYLIAEYPDLFTIRSEFREGSLYLYATLYVKSEVYQRDAFLIAQGVSNVIHPQPARA